MLQKQIKALEKTKKVSNKVLVHSLKNISKILKSGDLLIIRGTVQVGFTSNLAKKIIEKNSKLKVGSTINCFLERIENMRTGEIVLSYDKAKRIDEI